MRRSIANFGSELESIELGNPTYPRSIGAQSLSR
jgi:hypothetical protein